MRVCEPCKKRALKDGILPSCNAGRECIPLYARCSTCRLGMSVSVLVGSGSRDETNPSTRLWFKHNTYTHTHNTSITTHISINNNQLEIHIGKR